MPHVHTPPRRRSLGFAAILAVSASAPAQQTVPRAVADTSFTIAVIPDTQNYLDYTHQTAERFPFDASALFLGQMRYIAANVVSAGGDIAFVTALGDIWQHRTLAIDPGHAARGFKHVANPAVASDLAPTPRTQTVETPMARQGYQLIAGKVPFSVVPGNHDYDAMSTDANHPPNPAETGPASRGILHAGGLTNFKKVFSDKSGFFRGR